MWACLRDALDARCPNALTRKKRDSRPLSALLLGLVPPRSGVMTLLSITLAAFLGPTACKNSGPTAPEDSDRIELTLRLETENFTLLYSEPDQGVIEEYASALEANYNRIANDFLMAEIPRITASFYPDQESFTASTGSMSRGNTFSSSAFGMVSQPIDLGGAIHELAHCVAFVFYPTANDPPWLAESVALYEANQLHSPTSVPCLANREFPSIQLLGYRGPCSIYHVGYTIAEFIVDEWGFVTLRELILSNGDVPGILGISWDLFQLEWEAFVIDRYL